MPKQRIHREWFFPLQNATCRECGSRWPRESNHHGKYPTQTLNENKVWGWYEYVSAKKRHVRDVCPKCVNTVEGLLQAHADPCGCTFVLEINNYGSPLADTVRVELLKIESRLNGGTDAKET